MAYTVHGLYSYPNELCRATARNFLKVHFAHVFVRASLLVCKYPCGCGSGGGRVAGDLSSCLQNMQLVNNHSLSRNGFNPQVLPTNGDPPAHLHTHLPTRSPACAHARTVVRVYRRRRRRVKTRATPSARSVDGLRTRIRPAFSSRMPRWRRWWRTEAPAHDGPFEVC